MDQKNQARRDGRPQYYDIAGGDRVQCYHCLRNGLFSQYARGEAVINDPANAPDGSNDIFTICVNHLPENAVIHDPHTNVTRDKSGQNTWREEDTTEGYLPPSFDDPIETGGMA